MVIGDGYCLGLQSHLNAILLTTQVMILGQNVEDDIGGLGILHLCSRSPPHSRVKGRNKWEGEGALYKILPGYFLEGSGVTLLLMLFGLFSSRFV